MPNLDAVIFFNAKNSTVDVVQAVGRVMRRAEGKDYGYIILPIFVPAGMTPEEALDDSKVFANVWSILQALRSHDERIEAKVNALALHQEAAKNSYSGKADHKGWDEGLESRKEAERRKAAEIAQGVQTRLSLFPVERWERAVKTQLVKKCGTRIYWDEWAEDVARIAERHIERISVLVKDDEGVREQFDVFLKGLRDSLNPGITEDEAVQMIAQHIITVPVFEALFGDYEFAKSNPVSIAIDSFLESLQGHHIDEVSDAEVLKDVYASVRRRAAMVQTDTARQQLIRDLYEKFFKVAFKATSEKMGVVYTPTEIIDYILRETDRVLRREFCCGLADEGVHILDPFAGTGSFMAHLIESGLIPDDKLGYKYRYEIHSNEILLLAYYIMTINIEQAYHSRMGGEYVPFEGAVLTDTFQMTEEGDMLDTQVFTQNSERVIHQNKLDIRVIVGNPPYSVGQKSENDNNANEAYPSLDDKIAKTYVANSSARLVKGAYDSYIRAFRWASDRIKEKGIVCFVSNAGWLDAQAMDGMRKCVAEEFSSVHVFHLRGNQRTQGEESRREGGKIFGSGSRAPIAITMLVKNPDAKERGIFFHDVGDYLTREEKLDIVRRAAVDSIVDWQPITPDKHNDWLNQRNDSWYEFAPIALEKIKQPVGIFQLFSQGVLTARDAWACSFSRVDVAEHMGALLDVYAEEIDRYIEAGEPKNVDGFVEADQSKISWTERLKAYLQKKEELMFNENNIVISAYRPFCKQWLYYNKELNERTYQQLRLFPFAINEGKEAEKTDQHSPLLPNLVIQTAGISSRSFSCLITDMVPCFDRVEKGQCFPLYWYEKRELQGGLFDESEDDYIRYDAITDEALDVFRAAYPHAFDAYGRWKERPKKDGGIELNKEDIFYYIYGILHSPEYRKRFSANLKKELPRIPLAEDFRTFSKAGRELAYLHLNYETVEPYPLTVQGDAANPGRVQKMKWGKRKDPESGKNIDDHTILVYNENLTFCDIPEGADEYKVNGRSPLGWMIDRYQIKTDKASGIVNDPNDYSDDPVYISGLVPRLVTVSMETLSIVSTLPPLNERPQPADWPFAWKVTE